MSKSFTMSDENLAPSPFDAILKGLEEAIQARLPTAHITTTSLMGIWQVGVLYVTSHQLFSFQSGQIYIQLTADGFLVDRRIGENGSGVLVAYEDPDAIEKVLQLVVAIAEPQKVRRLSKTEQSSQNMFSQKL